ncbi:MAG: alpha-amylase [Lachnospiraceae bacterium]|nr:alpha-amylase [Lachnospiraceae bacterium]
MEDYRVIQDNRCYPMGTVAVEEGVHFSVISQGESCSLVLYQAGGKAPVKQIPFPEENRVGDVWSMTVTGDFRGMEYCFELDGKMTEDPFGKHFTGREVWGSETHLNQVLRASIVQEEYDWETDRRPEIPYEDCILYRIHPRGFTRHPSSKVENRGTFAGIAEKIPYLKELGITTVELLPAVEFQEVMTAPGTFPEKSSQELKPSGKLNYWGFVPALYFAPKASYCSGKEKHPEREFKDLVKALHRAGLELVMDFFFTGQEVETFVLEVLRFWAREYHVDGFHLIGFPPCRLIGNDPYLSRVKLFAQSWDGVNGGRNKHLARYNDGFAIDMKRVLKGDEGMVSSLAFHIRNNPKEQAVINFMANVNGFTLMDNVCYDQKHNEANGENNQDGTDYNYSWNCGVEGPTRKKKVVDMRRKLLRDAYLLTFLSQGTPLLMAGDEFGNTQNGNNNAYCQDNEISWLNWNLTETNRDLLEFVKAVIRFRKAHPMFHMPQEPKIMDYLSCGQPDVSYHGVKAWCPEFESFRRQLGILYCGKYGKLPDGTCDDYFFVVYNLHWEPHEFSLPNLPKGRYWHIAIDTDAKAVNGIYPAGEEPFLEKQKLYLVEPRTIMVFVGKAASPEILARLEEQERQRAAEEKERKEKEKRRKAENAKKRPKAKGEAKIKEEAGQKAEAAETRETTEAAEVKGKAEAGEQE